MMTPLHLFIHLHVAAVMLQGIQMNISPSFRTGEDDCEYVGVQHSEKFNRFFLVVYSHQQSMYDGPDFQSVQSNTKFP